MAHKTRTKEDWLKIGREYEESGPLKLAAELGVSKQRIQQIVARLRKEGAPIPVLRIKGVAKEVAEILIAESKSNKK